MRDGGKGSKQSFEFVPYAKTNSLLILNNASLECSLIHKFANLSFVYLHINMEPISDIDFDLVIAGTGLPQSLLALSVALALQSH